MMGVNKGKRGRWRAVVRLHGQQRQLGEYVTPREAAAVVEAFWEAAA